MVSCALIQKETQLFLNIGTGNIDILNADMVLEIYLAVNNVHACMILPPTTRIFQFRKLSPLSLAKQIT